VLELVRVARRMKSLGIDIVQAYGFYSNAPALLAGRLARVPILVASRRDLGGFLTPSQRLLDQWSFRLADRIVVNAEAIREQLTQTRRVARERIVVIPTGMDLSIADDGSDGGCRPAWADDALIVGMVAGLRAQKDQATLLRAAKIVLDAEPRALFVLVGDGERRGLLQQLAVDLGIAHAVRFIGGVEPTSVLALVRHFDVSVLASRGNEGIPNAVLEAMAVRKPVVASDTGGCREAVEDGATGFLVAVGDVASMANRILRLLQSPEERRRMGIEARHRVEQEFSLDRMVGRFADLYGELADEKLGVLRESRT